MFFVLTTGRSGSTSIARLINSLDGCYGVHEPSPELITESSAYRYKKISPEKIKDLLKKTRFSKVDGKIYCESNQTLSLIIPEIVSAFPQAKFIWLVRNGLDVVASAYQKQWYTGHSEDKKRYEDCSPIQKAWIDGRVRGDLAGEMDETEWNMLSRFEKCCWYWGYVNRVIGADLERYAPNRFYVIRLEDLEQDFGKLSAWMGFKVPTNISFPRENIAKGIPFHWTEWNDKQHQAFERWCKNSMDQFYASWHQVVGDDGKLLVSPIIATLCTRIKFLEKNQKEIQTELEEIYTQKTFSGLLPKILRQLKLKL